VPVTGESVRRTVVTPEATVPVMGATAPVTVETAGAAVPAAETGDAVLAAVTAFAAVAGVCVADMLSAPATGASAPVAVPASEAGEWVAAGAALEVACEAVEETGDVAELTAEATGFVAELTAEVTGDVAELTVEVTAESRDPGSVSEVAACACRENRSMITKIPAAAIASCTARRAMRRRIGCGMSSSHWPETGLGTRAHYQGLQSRAPRPS